MKDMFDCLEESYNPLEEQVFLIKVVKNKKKQKKKIYYLKTIGQGDKILWTLKREESMCLLPVRSSYIIVREAVRKSGISCQILRVPYTLKLTIRERSKPVRKKKWWDWIKVWFSRKVQYFAGYISIERLMKD
jgi:hypothetical protein